jgi:hypothetical protein
VIPLWGQVLVHDANCPASSLVSNSDTVAAVVSSNVTHRPVQSSWCKRSERVLTAAPLIERTRLTWKALPRRRLPRRSPLCETLPVLRNAGWNACLLWLRLFQEPIGTLTNINPSWHLANPGFADSSGAKRRLDPTQIARQLSC